MRELTPFFMAFWQNLIEKLKRLRQVEAKQEEPKTATPIGEQLRAKRASFKRKEPSPLVTLLRSGAEEGARQTARMQLEEYLKGQMPPAETVPPEEYYPAFKEIPEYYAQERESKRPGLGTLLGLQAFFESGLGKTTPNIFGVLPPEEKTFRTPREALEYQVSEKVLGGGETPAMNILSSQGPLTEEQIRNLYESYDPEKRDLEKIIRAYLEIEKHRLRL